MSLDVSLSVISSTEVYDANITHNLARMARAAGIYEAVWRPEENDIHTAAELIPHLEAGIERLRQYPDVFRQYDAENKWGTYNDFLPWLERYLEACRVYPSALVTASR